MMAAERERGQILILLAIWLFFGGGAASALIVYDRPAAEMKEAAERTIAADARRDTILTDIEQWEYSQKLRDEQVSEDREELLETLRRKDARRAEVETLVAKLDATFLHMDRAFLDLRFRVKGRVTSAEWGELVAWPAK